MKKILGIKNLRLKNVYRIKQRQISSIRNFYAYFFFCLCFCFFQFSFQQSIANTFLEKKSTSKANAINNRIVLSLTGEPPNLDSVKATDGESFFVLGHIMEGLTAYDKNGNIIPGVAERWTLTDKEGIFYLRKNAKWSDGKPVTAHDFVFALRTVIDPATASEYSFIVYPIKNAEALNTKKAGAKEGLQLKDLGVLAIDDYTLKITFEKPCGYFLALTSFATYYPMREDFRKIQGDKYAADADKLVYNGPFKLSSWVHGASLVFDKNEHYWNEKEIKINGIDVPYMTTDNSARFNLFRSNKIDVLGLTKDNLMNAQKENFIIKKFAEGTLFYLQFNFREGRITANKNLRKAISLLMNPSEYINRVVSIPGTTPGLRLIPQWMKGEKKLFKDEYPIASSKQDIVSAKKYMVEALKELKLEKLPPLVYLTSDSPQSTKEAEYFQGLFKTHLGIDLRIDKQIFKQSLAKQAAGGFDIVATGWGPDYADPMTYADLFSSWNENNRGKWKNNKYDQWIKKAQATSNQKIRMESMAQAEKILLEELPIIPTFERTIMYTHSDRIKGIIRKTVGFDPDYTRVQIVK